MGHRANVEEECGAVGKGCHPEPRKTAKDLTMGVM